MPPSVILKPNPTSLILLVPQPPLSPECTFNVTGLPFPSRATGVFHQQTGGQWGEMRVLVLGSRQASLQESGVEVRTRRGEAHRERAPEVLCYLAVAGGCAAGFTHLGPYNGEHTVGCGLPPTSPSSCAEPHWEIKSQGKNITYLGECPKPVSVRPLSSLASPDPAAASPLATERGSQPRG